MPGSSAESAPARTFDPAEALEHLGRADPVMEALLAGGNGPSFERDPSRSPQDHYGALIRAIVGQQLSTTVARVIWGRLLERFGDRTPTPQEILDSEPEPLRAAVGLSRAKVSFLRSLAEHVTSGQLDLEHVSTLSDEELIAELTAVKGIGEWSAHMFLMFQLERPDILATGDLGVRRGAQRAYGMEELPSAADLTELAEVWRPYRSAACRVLWWSLDNTPA